MKKRAGVLDGTPRKQFISSIIADYDLTKSICELIDNAIDIWYLSKKPYQLIININFELNQQCILIEDNAGGVHKSYLENLISPGGTTNTGETNTIGIFGVGTKRATIALANMVKIKSRRENLNTYLIEFDEEWLENDDWQLEYFQIENISKNTTIIELNKLRMKIDKDKIDLLSIELSEIYANFIKYDDIQLVVNGSRITPLFFNNWAYPPEAIPRIYTTNYELDSGKNVNIKIEAGLLQKASPTSGEYGVYFYCNDRLIVKELKSTAVGFISGIAGKPDANISFVRLIVSLKGDAQDMPWNSSKSDISTNHNLFEAIQSFIQKVLKDYCTLARSFRGNLPDGVFKHKTGKVFAVRVDDIRVYNKSYRPVFPKPKIRYEDKIKKQNVDITSKFPWKKGLYEGVVAADCILKWKKIDTRIRLALIILDTTIEIAFKDFLVQDIKERKTNHLYKGENDYYSNKKLSQIFEKRNLVIDEIKKYVISDQITDDDWLVLSTYHDMRNSLIHRRSSVDIPEDGLEKFRETVEKVISILHGLSFE